jgi:cytochrome c6
MVLAAILAVGAGASAPLRAQSVDGKPIYDEHCRECHGVRGIPPATAQLKYDKIATFNAAFIRKRSVDSIVTIMARGKGQDMKSFRDKLTKDAMIAVAMYVRELAERAKP